jgi:diaminopropionate ammonia-lyase
MQSVNGNLTFFSNTRAEQTNLYPEVLKSIASLENTGEAINETYQCSDYDVTPLHNLSSLSASLIVDKIWYKDESKRFQLKSCKAFSDSFSVARQSQKKLSEVTGETPSVQDLLDHKFDDIVRKTLIICASDGNHERSGSISWGCEMFSCPCVIYIHCDVSKGRQQAMEAFSADVIRITNNYYDSELVEQMQRDIPTHVFILGGVGGLASAVCAYFWALWDEQRPHFIVVETINANYLKESARAGKPIIVNSDLDTLMAGLPCGEVSALAWEILDVGANDFHTINEEAVPLTMQLLAYGFSEDVKIEAGESAVAGLSALITARHSTDESRALGLDESSPIYILGTEGATDPELYEQLINQR